MEQVESLCAVLGDETRVCGALAAVLRNEQRAVVGLRPEVILACLEERQGLQDELVRLVTRRRELVRDVALAYGTGDVESATALLPHLPAEPQSRVRTSVRALRRALLEARGLERQNEQLIGGSLESIGELLRALRALVPGARYDAGAQVASPPPTEQVDRRA
jgi:transposase